MKKFINDPEALTAEMLEGMALAYPEKIKIVSEKLVCRAKPKDADKVAILTLGGSGHEPALQGWTGEGMIDLSVVGDVFAAPGPPKVLEAMQMLKRDAGILLVTLNHAGDVMSAEMAKQMAQAEGIVVKEVLTNEEIRPNPEEEGRGLGGCFIVYKIAGAAAEKGMSLDEVNRVASKANENMAAIAVLSEIATHPSTGGDCGDMGADEMEICAGQHGEGGGVRMPMATSKKTAEVLGEKVVASLDLKQGDEILLIINGSGKTTLMEQLITFRDATGYFTSKGIKVARGEAGEFLTVQEAGGYQMIVCKLDQELAELWDAPCDTPHYRVR
ncbi:dihydroxyacetone kinase subunit DhaK [Cohaesibacter celericrescens]|uniref:Glycerol kinase n=1 Tax=Cohaesibacter celericrescens TaxID=2067669 RepID=A0A2N5XRK5_9HYPH|nr:dihydroxyacetone kinase subunit DhaK [Cohaesibacter celericrescens]PLW77151.1 glycerol kinase [Cohaesibacter celericrescens]